MPKTHSKEGLVMTEDPLSPAPHSVHKSSHWSPVGHVMLCPVHPEQFLRHTGPIVLWGLGLPVSARKNAVPTDVCMTSLPSDLTVSLERALIHLAGLERHFKLGMLVHTGNPRMQEAEA